MKKRPFYKEANLMINLLPLVAKEEVFAIKGGTAINFFWRELPRLSVDIDLAYTEIEERELSLLNISKALERICSYIEATYAGYKVYKTTKGNPENILKLVVSDGTSQIKIELNEVLRGFVFNPVEKAICKEAETIFEKSVSTKSLSFADLYGGKLCAALDRQHPRDIFDIMLLLNNEGITEDIRKAFIVYLISHDRPISEILEPTRKDIKQIYEREFLGMTRIDVGLNELINIREKYFKLAISTLSDLERRFLLSFKDGLPDWGLLGIKGVNRLPAVLWKLKNIQLLKKRNKNKHQTLYNNLKGILSL